MRILNDLHLGVTRSAGTTPSSQAALADWQMDQLEQLLAVCNESLVINGDLFDKFDVDNGVWLDTMQAFSSWLRRGYPLFLVPGNHDLAKDSSKVSAIALLYQVLRAVHGESVTFVDTAQLVDEHTYIIPHVPNQDLFDLELELVPADALYALATVALEEGRVAAAYQVLTMASFTRVALSQACIRALT